MAGGTAAVAAAPVVLSAVGFGAGGVVGGSIAAGIQSAVYGGSVGAGSLFALAQSAGAAGIGAAGNTAIGGITAVTTGKIAAFGAEMFVRFNLKSSNVHKWPAGHVLLGYPIFCFTEHNSIQCM